MEAICALKYYKSHGRDHSFVRPKLKENIFQSHTKRDKCELRSTRLRIDSSKCIRKLENGKNLVKKMPTAKPN